MRYCLLGLLTCLGLISCTTISVDEAYIFRPQKNALKLSQPSSGKMLFEEIFSTPEDVKIEIDANGEKARFELLAADFVPSTVEHGTVPFQDGELAYSLISRNAPTRPLIVHCGGNTADRESSGTLYAHKAIDFGDVLLFDYPGYGDTSGTPSIESFANMTITVAGLVEHIAEQERQIVLWGHSLGGFVCVQLAEELARVDAMVLETTAPTAQDVSQTIVPRLLKPFVKIKIAPSLQTTNIFSDLSEFEGSILVIGAARDQTLPVELSDKLAEGLLESGLRVTYLRLRDANHISVPTSSAFKPALEAFFAAL